MLAQLLEEEMAAVEKTEASFEPLEARYRLLEKFEVVVEESERAELASLRNEWLEYKHALDDAADRLQHAKDNAEGRFA